MGPPPALLLFSPRRSHEYLLYHNTHPQYHQLNSKDVHHAAFRRFGVVDHRHHSPSLPKQLKLSRAPRSPTRSTSTSPMAMSLWAESSLDCTARPFPRLLRTSAL